MKDKNAHDELYINAPHGIVIHRDFKVLYVDDNYAQLFGFEKKEDMLKIGSLLELIDPSEWDRSTRTYQAVMSGEKPPTVHSSRNLNKNKQEINVLVVDHVIEWQGQPAMQVTIVDLSQQVKAQKQIRDSERRYRELVDGSIQGILVHQNFTPLFANNSLREMFGLPLSAKLSEVGDMMGYIDPQHWKEIGEKHQQLMAGEQKQIKSEYKVTHVDGSSIWVNLLSSICFWEGKPAALATVVDMTEQKRLQQALEYKANHDGLTGLLNRNSMSEILESAVQTAKDETSDLCCILADIDEFKKINDCYGHHAGDKVLKIFSQRCSDSLLKQGSVGRWGGEEFIFLMQQVDQIEGVFIAERLRRLIASEPIVVGDISISVSASFGIALLNSPQQTAEDLVANADRALYKAKRKGRNCTMLFNEEDQHSLTI
ncbi:sensor domain-containing diguanylate cyclase [Pelagibaculum spongiae]|uniref:diguanylate cyclase n=1 Tax=Pelagibaculum spongiae TaxID=2080658 RepID=A0A2V1H4S6_9GAMM|nr:sensor domain-containing diguanylate cyclase [Pelagibaculum spongiae]PVZ72197.1 hypothetical protein DC094_04055 [Pelagibaculum spongiae]